MSAALSPTNNGENKMIHLRNVQEFSHIQNDKNSIKLFIKNLPNGTTTEKNQQRSNNPLQSTITSAKITEKKQPYRD